jgi:hypothetical protein
LYCVCAQALSERNYDRLTAIHGSLARRLKTISEAREQRLHDMTPEQREQWEHNQLRLREAARLRSEADAALQAAELEARRLAEAAEAARKRDEETRRRQEEEDSTRRSRVCDAVDGCAV